MRFHLILVSSFLTAAVAGQNVHIVNVPCCQFVDSVSGTNLTTVPAGTTVRWVKQGNTPHTVTNGSSPTAPGAGSVFNGTLNNSNPTFEFTFAAPGSYPYVCVPHFGAGMVGTVDVSFPGSATAVGAGCMGSNGQILTLGAAGGLPAIGNGAFALAISGGPAAGAGFLYGAVGSAAPGIPLSPACSLYLDPGTFFLFIQLGVSPVGPIFLNAGGQGSIPFGVPAQPSWVGGRLDLQFAAADPGATGGFTLSNALTLVFGS